MPGEGATRAPCIGNAAAFEAAKSRNSCFHDTFLAPLHIPEGRASLVCMKLVPPTEIVFNSTPHACCLKNPTLCRAIETGNIASPRHGVVRRIVPGSLRKNGKCREKFR